MNERVLEGRTTQVVCVSLLKVQIDVDTIEAFNTFNDDKLRREKKMCK